VVLRWTPQRAVWFGLVISGIAMVVCLALVFVRRRRPIGANGAELADPPIETSPLAFAGPAPSMVPMLVAAVTTALITAFISRWWIGLVVGSVMLIASRLTRGRLLLAGGAPVALAIGALFDVPELGWVALGLLVADLVAGWWWTRDQPSG
jgi:hypothetical protein